MRTDNDYEKEISHMVGIINDLETINAGLLFACRRGELHLRLCSPNTAAHKQLKRAISEATEKLL